MRKRSALLVYICTLLLASLMITFFVWRGLDNSEVPSNLLENYNAIKNELLAADKYLDESEDVEINVNLYDSNEGYLVSTEFINPHKELSNIVILVVDQSELKTNSEKIYPSLGIVGNFNNSLVQGEPNKKTTHSRLTFNYESNLPSEGVVVYFKYFDGAKECKCYLSISI